MPALNGCGLLGSSTHAITAPAKSYTVTSPVAAVVINGGAGMITVTGSSRTTIAVTEHPSYSNDAKPPVTSHSVATTMYGTTLTLSYSCPTQLNCGVGYTVAVPRGVTVRVSDREGAIVLASLAGPVSATTIAGAITATALGSRAAELSSRAGSIIAAFTAVPDSVRATANAGEVRLTLPRAAVYKVGARTRVGHTTISVRQGATANSVITASTDIGNVTINPA